ncbi:MULTISPECIES: BCCT family transporter [Virgibacillus]|uniref:Glycine betaine transporter OpuD n=2 Tax=Virgibacillus TaxID=84406 RepID=A0A024QHP9_9BACI|nr:MULTISPECIES: BCCT family transporter [Virgibacillus]EQB36845.1 glycine/betaine ABC transporter permease [Virgibacillus sp. CM-4]MYL43024.1 BCCT family transporter [Virgibacillus massiliensis]GGJ65690.1 glycine/betaine ABC transporter [Virgibacillus kapii]CDQ42068.1 Glycine betaine transporter OpuD [Virgibacillus massiliensis]
MNQRNKNFSSVFTYASIIVGILVLLGAIFPDQFGTYSGAIGAWITEAFGWYYMTLFTLILIFCIFLGFSPIGKLKLGKPTEKPEFNTISWLTMLFSAGMGIGLVFYGSSEPISHYLAPPTADAETKAALAEAMRSTFLHYGFHPWAVYGIVALALAYSQFRKGEVGLISKTLRPVLGNKVDGPIGNIVDVLAVFATIIGVAVSLGVGAMQINGGLNYLFGIPNNIFVQGIIIAIVTVLFLYSAWSGLSKGIQYLSNLNMILAGLLFIAILILGPTLLILNMVPSATGDYLSTLIFSSLDVAPLNEQKHEWMQSWTIYYWGWWMSWSPFVGIFIARVSRGRSIREFILAVLFVPTIVSIFWFSAFGLTGIEAGQSVPQLFELPPETQLFGIFNELPISIILSIIALVLISSFFITSADSATFVLGMQTAFGTLHPKNFVKIVWGLSLSAIAYVLLLSGGETGLDALQSAAIISALPFSVVVILMAVAFYKDANQERKYLGLTLTPNKKRMKEYMDETRSQDDHDNSKE